MSPEANNEHQALVGNLRDAFRQAIGDVKGKRVLPGCNVSDNAEHWKKNYRIPDVAVFLLGNPAEDLDTHWFGGPDFAVEIRSKGDRSRKKFDFYAKVGVKELLLVDRDRGSSNCIAATVILELVGSRTFRIPGSCRAKRFR